MATSLSYSFSPSVINILYGALRILRVIQEGQEPSAYAINNAREAMEYIITQLAINQVPVWTRYTIEVPIVVDRNPYTIGPGLNIDIGPSDTITDTLVPVDIFRVMYKYALDGQRVKLEPIGRQDYLDYALPDSGGVSNSWYYDKQLNYGKLFLYPVPDSTCSGDYLVIDVQRYIYSAGVNTDKLDMPLEFNHWMKWAIAEELLCEYEQPPQREAKIAAKAQELYMNVCQSNGDKSSVFFIPDTRYDNGDGWNE